MMNLILQLGKDRKDSSSVDELLTELEINDMTGMKKKEPKTQQEDSWFYESCSMLFFKPINWFFSFLHFNREQKSTIINNVDQDKRIIAATKLINALDMYKKHRGDHAPSSLYTFFCSGFTLSYLFKKNEDEIIDSLTQAILYGSSEQVFEDDDDNVDEITTSQSSSKTFPIIDKEFKPIDHSYFSCIRNNALGSTLRSYIKDPNNRDDISLITETKMPEDQSQYTISEFISAINDRVVRIKDNEQSTEYARHESLL